MLHIRIVCYGSKSLQPGLGPPVTRSRLRRLRTTSEKSTFLFFGPLLAISGPRDPSQMKDLTETPRYGWVSSNFDLILIPIDHDLWISIVFHRFTSLEAISGPRDPFQMKDLAETHLFGPSFIKFRLIFDTYWPRCVNYVSTSNEWSRFVTHLLTVLIHGPYTPGSK